jgi:uncharacterized protein YndB with AHSA1/START domain
MIKKEKFELEYTINASPALLFYRINNPSGLEEWFADKVTEQNSIFTFTWSNSEQKAELIEKKANEFVKFKWLGSDDDTYFEIKIIQQELSGDVGLLITDFAAENEKSDIKDMWDEQINGLKHTLGV